MDELYKELLNIPFLNFYDEVDRKMLRIQKRYPRYFKTRGKGIISSYSLTSMEDPCTRFNIDQDIPKFIRILMENCIRETPYVYENPLVATGMPS